MKFRPNTLVTLGASAVFGLAAVFVARSWINNSVESEFQTAQTISESVKVPLVKTITKPVVVANVDLNFGDTLTRAMLETVEYPEQFVPKGAYETIDDLLESNPRRVLLSHIAQFEPMLSHKMSGEGGRRALSELIADGKRAATFRVNTTSSVGGYILPNDRVDVLYVNDITQDTDKLTPDTLITQLVFQNMKVLGVDLQSGQRSETIAARKSVTLEVTNEEAQKLIMLENTGRLILTLRAAGESEEASEYTLKFKDIMAGSIAPKRTYRRPTSKPSKTTTNKDDSLVEVTVFRGDNQSQVSVQNDKGEQDYQGRFTKGGQ